MTARRTVPWWWIAAGLVALFLVGRGVVGAMGSGRTTAAPAAQSRSPAPPLSPVATSSPAGTPTAAPTTLPDVPLAPTGLPPRVTLPLATTSTATVKAGPTATTAQPPRSQQPIPVTCAVSTAVQPFWGGYNESVRITNTGRTVVQGWTLTFQLPQGQSLINGWNAGFSASGTSIRAGSLRDNETLAPEGSVEIGFQAKADRPAWPSSFALNGVTCR